MSDVWRADDLVLGIPVALKTGERVLPESRRPVAARRLRADALMISRPSTLAAAIAFALSIAAAPARAQSSSSSSSAAPSAPSSGASRDEEMPSLGQLLTGTLRTYRQLPSLGNLEVLGVGAIAAVATHPADSGTSRALADSSALHEPFEAGAFLGGTPFELGAAFATYGLGRAFHNRRIARAGADLVQAQLVAESLTLGVKQISRRPRPEGSVYSFPSGHTAATFATATVLQRHFGWKIGIPAYALATYVGASRIQTRQHYLSDVAFGAALGTVAGRTVTLNRRRGLALSLAPVNGGGAVVFGVRQ